jgi:hypothetical protein
MEKAYNEHKPCLQHESVLAASVLNELQIRDFVWRIHGGLREPYDILEIMLLVEGVKREKTYSRSFFNGCISLDNSPLFGSTVVRTHLKIRGDLWLEIIVKNKDDLLSLNITLKLSYRAHGRKQTNSASPILNSNHLSSSKANVSETKMDGRKFRMSTVCNPSASKCWLRSSSDAFVLII